MEVVLVTAEQTRPLRHLVLRPSQAIDATDYPGDHDADTRHVGAMDQGRLVGISSLYREPRPGGPPGGWRLRGMATALDVRGRGAGRALLAACRDHVAADGGGELWCNARIVARDFYTAAGFEPVGDEFEIEDIGPHVVMRTEICPSGVRTTYKISAIRTPERPGDGRGPEASGRR